MSSRRPARASHSAANVEGAVGARDLELQVAPGRIDLRMQRLERAEELHAPSDLEEQGVRHLDAHPRRELKRVQTEPLEHCSAPERLEPREHHGIPERLSPDASAAGRRQRIGDEPGTLAGAGDAGSASARAGQGLSRINPRWRIRALAKACHEPCVEEIDAGLGLDGTRAAALHLQQRKARLRLSLRQQQAQHRGRGLEPVPLGAKQTRRARPLLGRQLQTPQPAVIGAFQPEQNGRADSRAQCLFGRPQGFRGAWGPHDD